MKTSELLKAGRELITAPEHWTQHVSAKDAYGDSVFAGDATACQWCSVGALDKVAADVPEPYAWLRGARALRAALPSTYSIPEFNDRHSHSEVLQLWDKAIVLAEKEENESL